MKIAAHYSQTTFMAVKSRKISVAQGISQKQTQTTKGKISYQEKSKFEQLGLDLKIQWKAKSEPQKVGNIWENNIKISIDSALSTRFDSLKLKISLNNSQAKESAQNIKLNLKVQLKETQKLPEHNLSSHRTSLLLKLDYKSEKFDITKASTTSDSFFDEKISDYYSDNIFDFIKKRFDIFMSDDSDNTTSDTQKIDDFFSLIKKAVDDGYKEAKKQLGELDPKIEDGLKLTMKKVHLKIDFFYQEVSSKKTAS